MWPPAAMIDSTDVESPSIWPLNTNTEALSAKPDRASDEQSGKQGTQTHTDTQRQTPTQHNPHYTTHTTQHSTRAHMCAQQHTRKPPIPRSLVQRALIWLPFSPAFTATLHTRIVTSCTPAQPHTSEKHPRTYFLARPELRSWTVITIASVDASLLSSSPCAADASSRLNTAWRPVTSATHHCRARLASTLMPWEDSFWAVAVEGTLDTAAAMVERVVHTSVVGLGTCILGTQFIYVLRLRIWDQQSGL